MGTNSVTTVDLTYWFRVSNEKEFVLLFQTKQLGATQQASESTLVNEVDAGVTFSQIQNLGQVVAVVDEGFSTAVHRLFTLPPSNRDLRITIDLMRTNTERHVEIQGDTMFNMHPQIVENVTSQSPAKLILNKCQILSMKPDGDRTYVASFQVNGGLQMSLKAET